MQNFADFFCADCLVRASLHAEAVPCVFFLISFLLYVFVGESRKTGSFVHFLVKENLRAPHWARLFPLLLIFPFS